MSKITDCFKNANFSNKEIRAFEKRLKQLQDEKVENPNATFIKEMEDELLSSFNSFRKQLGFDEVTTPQPEVKENNVETVNEISLSEQEVVNDTEFTEFKDGKVADTRLRSINDKIDKGTPISIREKQIYDSNNNKDINPLDAAVNAINKEQDLLNEKVKVSKSRKSKQKKLKSIDGRTKQAKDLRKEIRSDLNRESEIEIQLNNKNKEDAKRKDRKVNGENAQDIQQTETANETVQQNKSGIETNQNQVSDQGTDGDVINDKSNVEGSEGGTTSTSPPPTPPVDDTPQPDTPNPEDTKDSKLGERTIDNKSKVKISEDFKSGVDDIKVLTRKNEVTVKQADEIINKVGQEEAIKLLFNGDIDLSVRATIGQRIVKQLSDAADNETDVKVKNELYDKAIDAFNSLMKLSNDIGRALQVFRMWSDMGPEGYIRYAKRAGNKIRGQIGKKYDRFIKDISDISDKVADEAARRLFSRLSSTINIDKTKLINLIKSTFGENISGKLQSDFNIPKDQADKLADTISKSFKDLYTSEFNRKAKAAIPANLRKFRSLIDDISSIPNLKESDITDAILSQLNITTELTDAQLADIRSKLAKLKNIPEDSIQLKNDGAMEALNLINDYFGENAKSFLNAKDKDSIFWGLFYSSMLSGPRTQALNIGANIVKLFADNMFQTIDNYRQGKGGKDRLLVAASNWVGLIDGLRKKGISEGKEVLLHGRKKSDRSSKFFDDSSLERWGTEWKSFNEFVKDAKKTGFTLDFQKKWLAFIAKYVPRFMSAVDVAFYWSNYFGNLRNTLSRKKSLEGLSGKELREAVNDSIYGGKLQIENAELKALGELKPYNVKTKQREWGTRVSGKDYNSIDLKRRVDEILENSLVDIYGEDVLYDADRFAKNATFQQEPKGVMGSLARTIQRAHANPSKLISVPARLIVPFTKIVANVTNDQLDYTPIGVLRGLDYRKAGELSPEERRMAFLKGMSGMLILGLGVLMMYSFDPSEDDDNIKIHGNGPRDFSKLLQLKGNNWQPNSIQVGDKYFSTGEFPFGLMLTIIGNTFDIERYEKGKKDKNNFRATFDSFLSVPKTILDASFLSGASRFFDTVLVSKSKSPEKRTEAFAKWVADQPKVIIPQFFRQFSNSMDPTWYQTEGVIDYLYKQYALPFVQATGSRSDKLTPYQTALGDNVTFGREGTLPTMARLTGLSRFVNIKEEDKELYNLLNDKNIFISGLGYGTTINKKNIWKTDRELFNKINKERGFLIKKYLENNIDRLKTRSKTQIEAELDKILKRSGKDSLNNKAKIRAGAYKTKKD